MNEALGFSGAADRLQRVLPGGRARDGELRHRVEHGVVVLHGSRQRHLLRDADVSDEPRGVPARQGAVQRRDRAGCRRWSPSLLAAALLGVPLRPAGAAAARRRGHRRHGGLVLLLRDLRARHPPQRRVQHGDVDLLLRVPVRQLDVLPDRAAAGGVPRRRARQPDHLARGRHAVCDDRRRRSADGLRSRRRRFVLFTAASFVGALVVLRRES